MSNQWYPFYPGDYARDTSHLTMIEDCAFRRLLDYYYSTGKPLPANADRLQRICRAFADDEQRAVQYVVQNFFEVTPDGYRNAKADTIIGKAMEVSEKRAKAARKRHANHANAPANAPANASRLHSGLHVQPQPQPQPQPHKKEESPPLPPEGNNVTIIDAVTGEREDDRVKIPHELILAAYNKFCPSLPHVRDLTDKRRKIMRARFLKYVRHPTGPIAVFDALFKRAEASDFLTGRDGKWRGCGFDWLMNESNMVKVLEGTYDNRMGPDGYDVRARNHQAAREFCDE